jgi:Ca2+-binding EF-hand superfamily protein
MDYLWATLFSGPRKNHLVRYSTNYFLRIIIMKKTLAILGLMTIYSTVPALAMANTMDKDHMKTMVSKHMKMMDTNNDGKVSKEEFNMRMEKKFSDMDKNSDGMLTEQEMMDGKKME